MDQKTRAWYEWRHAGIGSSDVPVLLGLSPYKTAYELYLEKIAPVPDEMAPPNFVQAKGIRLEEEVRVQYEARAGKTLSPHCLQMADHPFMRSSLDGYDSKAGWIIEIKYVGKEDFIGARMGQVPRKYVPQVQHQLLVSQTERCYFVCTDGNRDESQRLNMEVVWVKPDRQYQEMLLRECWRFWNGVQRKQPPAFADADFKLLRGKGLAGLAQKLQRLMAQEDYFSEEAVAIRKQLVSLASAPRMRIENLRIINGVIEVKK